MRLLPLSAISPITLTSASATSPQGSLLSFFREEIGSSVYKQAVAGVQRSLLPQINELESRASELGIEVRAEEFQYWPKYDAAKSRPRKQGTSAKLNRVAKADLLGVPTRGVVKKISLKPPLALYLRG